METVVSKYSKPKATVTRRPLLKPVNHPAHLQKMQEKSQEFPPSFLRLGQVLCLTKVRVNKIFEIPNPNGEIMRNNPL